MQTETLHPLFDNQDGLVPYCYLLEWEWPEHIELLLRRMIWSQLNDCGNTTKSLEREAEHDSLATKIGWFIAVSPETNPSILDALSYTNCKALVERIAENPNTSQDTLKRLAVHPALEVRCAVSENSNTPVDVIAALAQDECIDVRFTLAESPTTPEEILDQLTEDDNCYVASRARQTLIRLNPPQVAVMPFTRQTVAAKEGKRKFGG